MSAHDVFFVQSPGDANTASGWLPETDIYETEANLVLQADLPGFKANERPSMQGQDEFRLRRRPPHE